MLPWLYSVLDYNTTPESYERYDKMSALDMFRSYGVSKRMYEEFIKPTLLVGLFAPPEELSAGATMGMLYYYGALPQRGAACLCDRALPHLYRATAAQLVPTVQASCETRARFRAELFVSADDSGGVQRCSTRTASTCAGARALWRNSSSSRS